ncbi:MAG: tetratricopeptide repeat protein [Muribaculaceae bacterium]|nr:tetratricopeptide repeat protein [Muribaculaceae bacterium]
MKNKILVLLAVMVFSNAVSSFAVNKIAEADSAYSAGEYGKAIELYKTVVEEEGKSVALLYNLGNAYFQEGDYGNAMVCYQRAHRLDPSNPEVNANLRYLSGRVEDANKAEQKGKRFKTGQDEQSFFQSVHKSVAENVSSDVWAVWAAVAFVLFVGCVALYIFTRGVILRKIGFFGGLLLICVSVVFLIFSFMGARAYHSADKGVLTAFKTVLMTEPGKDADAEKGQVLTKGTVVQILSEEVDAEGNVTWYKIRLNSDYIGWVAASDLDII